MNKLYSGDNLQVLRDHIPDESVDLIYLDPPFNSNRSCNVLFREANGTAADAQIRALDMPPRNVAYERAEKATQQAGKQGTML